MKRSTVFGGIVLTLCLVHSLQAQENLRERLDDENGVRSDVWVYNDIEAAARAGSQREQACLCHVSLCAV